MKRRVANVLMGAFALAVAGAMLSGIDAYAKKPGGDGCPYSTIVCTAHWDPVLCSDGNIYSNDCYAMRNCQFDCESLGQGPVPVEW